MLRHVTAGVDGTAESLAAAHWAAREALRRGAGLRLVHTPRWPAAVPSGADAPAQEGERVLERVAAGVRAAHPGLRITGRAVPDPPVAALLAAAGEAELLVLGACGRGDATGGAVGAVCEQVVARSGTPVVLVRAGESSADEHLPAPDGISPEEIPEIPYRDVVLGLGISRPCDELIEFAFASARCRTTVLHVIHASPPATARAVDGTARPSDAQEETLAALLRPWREKFPTVPVVETVVAETAADALVRASGGAALAVVGRRTGDGRLAPRIGPVTRTLLHHARCSVAVVPHG
ncbi:universal stress protein [Streptomyces sp. Act143]|uniref:universal stress protein n=1 Tax=Streptomyces sp. Act143 TaxID=2200760 RepID=UPI000D671FEC|nr:universal stress protein [Streptomyces sp. Act143]PWI13212.1 universal stress protein [Streptomyces sp. Act143]